MKDKWFMPIIGISYFIFFNFVLLAPSLNYGLEWWLINHPEISINIMIIYKVAVWGWVSAGCFVAFYIIRILAEDFKEIIKKRSKK